MEHTTAFRKESHLPGVLLFSRAMLNFRAAYPPCISSWWMILRKSSQGFDFNLPHGIYQLWHRMINFISIYDVAFMRWCYPRCIFSTTFSLACFQSVLCSVLFASLDWHLSHEMFLSLMLTFIWSDLILSDPILFLTFQSCSVISYFNLLIAQVEQAKTCDFRY